MMMNLMLGREGAQDINELYNEETDEIIKGEKYNELFHKISYSFPVYYINEKTIPTLNACGGRDIVAGIGQFAYLEEKFAEHNNKNLTLVYSRYAPHYPFEIDTENGIEKIKEMNSRFIEFSEKYFTKN